MPKPITRDELIEYLGGLVFVSTVDNGVYMAIAEDSELTPFIDAAVANINHRFQAQSES